MPFLKAPSRSNRCPTTDGAFDCQTRAFDCREVLAETCKALLRGGPVVVRAVEARPGAGSV